MQIEKGRGDKGNFVPSMPSMGSSRIDNGFGDPSIDGGMRTNSSGFGPGVDADVFKSKGVFAVIFFAFLPVRF